MKILHITWSADKAGMLTDLLTVQTSDPCLDIMVCFGTMDSGYFIRPIERLGLKPIILGMRSRYSVIENFRGAFRLLRILKNYQFDIIHLQEALLPLPFLVVVLFSNNAKILLHNRGEFNYTETTSQKLAQFVKKIFYALIVPHNVDCLICNSHFTVQNTPTLPFNKPYTEVLFNAIDFSVINTIKNQRAELRQKLCNELNIDKNACIVSVVARLVEFKRIDRFIDALSKARHDAPNIQALIVGEGPLRKTLQKQVTTLGLSDSVKFLGYRTDAKEITGSSDLFVLPSEGEAFGISALEAVALGVPVLLFSDAGGPTEFVTGNVTGFVADTVEDMALKIRSFYKNKLSITPNNKGIDQFSIDYYCNKIKLLYSKITS